MTASYRIPLRLRELLGPDIEAVDEAGLEALLGLAEDTDLEVKREPYGNGDSARRELAADIAALANGAGGLLIVGIGEDGDVLAELTPCEIADGERVRVMQIVSGNVVPHVDVAVRLVESSAGGAYLLVGVERSPSAPHAVRKNNDLGYPVRSGAAKRWMTEAEVADRYMSRFADAQSRAQQLRRLHAGSREAFICDPDSVWLLVCAVPDVGGHAPTSLRNRQTTETWLEERQRECPPHVAVRNWSSAVSVGMRRFVVAESAEESWVRHFRFELHSDGASALLFQVGWRVGDGLRVDASSPLRLDDEVLSMNVLAALRMAGAHADRCGAAGNLQVSAQTYVPADVEPFGIGSARGGWRSDLHGSRSARRAEVAFHTLPLASLADIGPELVASAFLIVSDLEAALGVAEPYQLALDGSISLQHFQQTYQPHVTAWAAEFGINVR